MSRLLTLLNRRNPEFDIFTHPIDPALSPYNKAEGTKDYARKVLAFYEELGIESALWTVHENQRIDYVTPGETCEYTLRVDESRVVAYVNDLSWDAYLKNRQSHFEYSSVPVEYQSTSLLVVTPILQEEVIVRQILKPTDSPEKDERYFDSLSPKARAAREAEVQELNAKLDGTY